MTRQTRRRVLIVEDSYYLASDIARILRKERIETLGPCSCAEQARSQISVDRPDCAILDINLGGETCFDLADLLESRSIPVLFYTGYDPEILPVRYRGALCLHKPASSQMVLNAVLQLLRQEA